MAFTEIEHAQKRMQQKWHDLVMAEQQGASIPVLERMYNAYMLAVEEYNRCCEALTPIVQDGRRERKAS
ncbi:MAG TPA: hypothetical protein VKV37_17830 [Ktedonobacteraceae bacterium]|jgi:hypothetical protein|nr:hypothetical protein [Ktedonobacteraceae bacterium]